MTPNNSCHDAESRLCSIIKDVHQCLFSLVSMDKYYSHGHIYKKMISSYNYVDLILILSVYLMGYHCSFTMVMHRQCYNNTLK